MFQIGDYVVYKNDVCRINELKDKYFQSKNYYRLSPIDDDSLIIDVPVENKYGLLKPIMSKREAILLIEKIPNIESITISDKLFDNEYRNLMNTFEKEDIIKVIKTTYLKNEE